ncbi:hypothetical protein [Desulfatiglans anilini]|uniref:hypothetical protein n=1 Tax=Desulfatiglans anilini TaxID=90728 RepID=UPI0012947383|nr:hypothetical protein [Desulfatiglans anilini]
MNTKKTFTIAIIALLSIAVFSTTAWAKKVKTACPAGLTGTWVGAAGGDIHWLATHTSDSLDPTKGEMIMNWTYIKSSFIGSINSGYMLTPGHGVWQLNGDGDYDYTWYAYAINRADGSIGCTIRVSGVAMLKDFDDLTVSNCDTAVIYYHFDIAEGEVLPMNLSTAEFTTYEIGGALQVRVPLVVTPLPE